MDKKAQIKAQIANNRIDEAIKLLKEELGDEVIPLESQWKKLGRDEMMGVIAFADANVLRNKIVSALLSLIDEVGKPKTEPKPPASSGKKVFISYNHQDRPAADQVVAFLSEKGFAITIDHKDLLGGRDIQDWITECLRTHKFVVSLVSEYSLKSGWVGMESIMAFFAEKLSEQSAQFIALNLQENIFEADVIDGIYDFLEEDLDNVRARINKYLERGRSTESLNGDLTRKQDHLNNLGKIVDRLKRCKTINASGHSFGQGLEELTRSLA